MTSTLRESFAGAAWLFATCWVLARLEIEIEGDQGWAAALPTWRYAPPWLLKLTNGKPLTGYHLFLTALLLLFFHLPCVVLGWSRLLEARALSDYFFATFVWDLQWFVWNPAWGPRRYFSEPIWWFPRRLLGFPADYYAGLAASFAATALFWPAGIRLWTARALWLAAFSAATLALAGTRAALPGRR